MHINISAAEDELFRRQADKPKKSIAARLDGVDPAAVAGDAASFALQDIAVNAAAAVQQWVETSPSDLDSGEGMADRLIALLVGVADDNKDGELSDDEQAVVQVAMNAAWDYLSSKGVDDSDLAALFGDDVDAANEAGSRIAEYMVDALPEGDEAASDEVDSFAFGSDGQDPVFDGVAVLDAVYKKRFAIRGGQKVVVRKRVSGTVRLSARQKVAIRKASLRANSAGAKARRMKSMRMARRMGLAGR